MLYEMKAILKEIEKLNKKLEKNVFTKNEMQEIIEDISDFPKLLDNVKRYASLLEQADKDNVNAVLEILSDLDMTLNDCTKCIEMTSEEMRKLLLQFPGQKGRS